MPQGFDPARFDPHAPDFLADPFPTYASFREYAPVYPVKDLDSHWIFRYEDCANVLNDTNIWVKNPPGGVPPAPGPYAMMSNFPEGLFASDPPLHTQLRQILQPLIDETIANAPQLAREIGEPLLAAARSQGRMELVADYALPLPARVLFTLLGIPDDDQYAGVWNGLIVWQAAIVAAHDHTQPATVRGAGATCSMALNSFFEGMLLERQRNSKPPEGLFAQMCEAFQQAGLSPQQVQVCACDLVVAGYLSTTFILGTGVRNLILHPEQMDKLRRDPALIHSALEEMLRFDGPIHLVDRCAAGETEVAGHQFKPGDRVSMAVASANRDPGAFSEPDRFDIERSETMHLAFGEGVHQCIGAPLIRKVAPVALEMLLAEFSELVIDGPPEWQPDPYLRALMNLPLRLSSDHA
jgi:pimeloyl-[acyl-carrier protein] synthase